MSTSEETPKKESWLPFVKMVIAFFFIITMVVFTILTYTNYRQSRRSAAQSEQKHRREIFQREQEYQERYYPSFERSLAQIQELADKGCQAPFEHCPYLDMFVEKSRVFEAMNREKIVLGTHGVTQDKLDELEGLAMARIASQKLAYLKANGGAKLPSDIELLVSICAQVYVYKRTLPGGNPTESELKQLLPQGVTHVDFCYW